ncbi:MAG: o-succinylbenzoate synthase [Balneolaceae bacterium]|nr:o-succinylbenzoate synthase [Balneolaceae bacterium]
MNLEFYKYSIPFKTPFVTAGQTFSNRSGVIVLLHKNTSITLGEAAPLPAFSAETTQQVIRQIRAHIEPMKQFFNSDFSLSDLNEFLKTHPLAPSLQFCLYTLATSHLALAKNQSLQQALFANPVDSVAVNAVIDLTKKEVSHAVNQKVEQGFTTIKIKAGNDTRQFIQQLSIIRDKHPNINIRLDANQSWSLNQAIDLFAVIEDFNIEYCEEPLANPNRDTLLELKNRTSIPIALDESLAHTFSLLEAATLADVLVIKPMVHGPVIETLTEISNQTNIKMVFTSSLESALGRLMTAALAAGLGSTDMAHGLATGQLLSEDLWDDNDFIRNGRYKLPGPEKLRPLMGSHFSGITTERLNIE